MSLQVRLQSVSEEFQKLQNDLSNTVEARQRLDAQLSENELVKKVTSFRVKRDVRLTTLIHRSLRS